MRKVVSSNLVGRTLSSKKYNIILILFSGCTWLKLMVTTVYEIRTSEGASFMPKLNL